MKIINDTLELDSYELTIFEHSYNAIIITTTYLMMSILKSYMLIRLF